MKKLLLCIAVMLAANLSQAQWEPDVRLTNAIAASYLSANSNANVINASGDTLRVVWADYRDGSNGEIYYKRSTDNGQTWDPDLRLTNSSQWSYDPCIAISGLMVHVLWCEGVSDTIEEIYYKCSEDGGTTWGTDIRLTNSNRNSESPAVAIDGSVIHVVWMDYYTNWDYEIFYKRSLDGGLTWDADIRMTHNTSYCGYPGVVASGSNVHVVWEDDRDENGEIYFKRSADGGLSWGDDIRLTNDPADSWDPAISLNDSVVHIVWQDNRDGGAYEIYYKRSTDGGMTWGDDTRLTNAPAPSEYPTIAVSGSNVHITWQDQRDMNYEIYYKKSEDAGLTWGNDTRLTNIFGNSEWPHIAVANSTVHILWDDARDGNDEIYYKRNPTGNFYVGIENAFVNDAGHQIKIWPNPATTTVHVNFDNYSNENFSISIRNILGEEVCNRKIQNGETIIDISGLKTGFYFLSVTGNNKQSWVTRLVITK